MECPDILREIVEVKRIEVAKLRGSLTDLKSRAANAAPALDFKKALTADGMSVIAEIKKASPSAGIIAEDFNPAENAEAYSEGAADAVSVLTDRKHFKGDISYISLVRPILRVPILRKDFIIDESQIFEARAAGADTFLLISAILEVERLRDFLELGRALGMEALVESHDERELERAIESGAAILGINNRDLRDFTVDISRSARLIEMMPENAVKVSESGIRTPKDCAELRSYGFDAVLVGESLMRSGLSGASALIKEFKLS